MCVCVHVTMCTHVHATMCAHVHSHAIMCGHVHVIPCVHMGFHVVVCVHVSMCVHVKARDPHRDPSLIVFYLSLLSQGLSLTWGLSVSPRMDGQVVLRVLSALSPESWNYRYTPHSKLFT